MKNAHVQAPTSATFLGYLSEVQQQRQIRDHEALARHRAKLERLRPIETTRQATERAAFGTKENSVGDLFHDRILISNDLWATWICEAGRAMAKHPGMEALRAQPIKIRGDGMAVGLRLFEMAVGGTNARKLATALQKSREALGANASAPGQPRRRLEDTEVGIWYFFRQIHETFCNGTWSNPEPSVTPGRILREQPPALTSVPSAQPPDAPAVQKPLTRKMAAVWKALEGKSLTAKELLALLIVDEPTLSLGTLRMRVSDLRKQGCRIDRSCSVGYSRPDARDPASSISDVRQVSDRDVT